MQWSKVNPMYAFLASCLVCLLVNCSSGGRAGYPGDSSFLGVGPSDLYDWEFDRIKFRLSQIEERFAEIDRQKLTEKKTEAEFSLKLLEATVESYGQRIGYLESDVRDLQKTVAPLRTSQMIQEIERDLDRIDGRKGLRDEER
ncbi:MAG: hypothetical protein QM570_19035 [Planctomycetota bacterium]|jgi:hypothetical protein|nr:hypothetical protein [Planctomycetota bacterium]